MLIIARSCSKSSSWFNGATRHYCATHNHEMTPEQYHCQLGQLESQIIAQVQPVVTSLTNRIAQLENQITPSLRTFAENLEKLHEPDTGPPTTKP